jgi:hypothetical protein
VLSSPVDPAASPVPAVLQAIARAPKGKADLARHFIIRIPCITADVHRRCALSCLNSSKRCASFQENKSIFRTRLRQRPATAWEHIHEMDRESSGLDYFTRTAPSTALFESDRARSSRRLRARGSLLRFREFRSTAYEELLRSELPAASSSFEI